MVDEMSVRNFFKKVWIPPRTVSACTYIIGFRAAHRQVSRVSKLVDEAADGKLVGRLGGLSRRDAVNVLQACGSDGVGAGSRDRGT